MAFKDIYKKSNNKNDEKLSSDKLKDEKYYKEEREKLQKKDREEKLKELKEKFPEFYPEPKTEAKLKDTRSRYIPQHIKDKVWNRDGGKCVQCGSNENIEFDHIVPFSKGGSNTYRNLQILCEKCNRSKSSKIE